MRTAWLALVVGLAIGLAGCETQTRSGPAPRDSVVAPDTDSARRARTRLELAGAYFAQGQSSTALDEVKLALNLNPSLPEAWNMRGLIYASLGDATLADESFQRALQLAANDADSLHNYGWFQCQNGRYVEAESLFARALVQPQYRDSPRTLLAQGVCRARAGKLAEAEQVLQRAFELEPVNLAVAVNLAEVLYRRGDFERARFYIRRANSQPDVVNAQTLWLAARIEQRAGNRQGAADFGTQLRSRFPQSPEAAAFERGDFQ